MARVSCVGTASVLIERSSVLCRVALAAPSDIASDVRASSLDDPKCFACRWLDDVRRAIDRVTQRGIETHLVHTGIAAITSATIVYVHAVIRAFGVVSIAVFERVATVCTRDVRFIDKGIKNGKFN